MHNNRGVLLAKQRCPCVLTRDTGNCGFGTAAAALCDATRFMLENGQFCADPAANLFPPSETPTIEEARLQVAGSRLQMLS